MKARLRDLGDSFPLKLHPEIGHRWNKTLSIKYSDTTHRHLQTVPTSVVDWQIQNCIATLTAHHTARDSFSRKGKKEEGPGGRRDRYFQPSKTWGTQIDFQTSSVDTILKERLLCSRNKFLNVTAYNNKGVDSPCPNYIALFLLLTYLLKERMWTCLKIGMHQV